MDGSPTLNVSLKWVVFSQLPRALYTASVFGFQSLPILGNVGGGQLGGADHICLSV